VRTQNPIRVFCLVLLALAVIGSTARAQSPAPDDRWTFAVQPYVFLPSSNATLKYDIPEEGGSADVEITNPVLEELSFAAMVSAEARKGRWAIVTDFLYLDCGGQDSRVRSIDFAGPGGQVPISASANLDTSTTLKGGEWTLAGSYTLVHGESSALEVLAGFRYLGLETSTSWHLTGAVTGPGPGQSFDATGGTSDRVDLWDGIAGVRGRLGLGAGRWGIPFYLDVGTGSSTLTAQVVAGIQYRFSSIDLNLEYRYLYYDVSGDSLVQDVRFAGPAVGVKFRF
jgi:opacity protein-like surface antigen